MRKSCLFVCLATGLPFVSAQTTPIGPPIGLPGYTGTGSTVPHIDDRKFLKEADLDGMAEIELGKLALEKASNSQVKQFAQRMVEDYTASHRRILHIASDETIATPKEMDGKRQSRVDRLTKLSGPGFDRAYIEDETKQRHQDLKEFTKASQGANDPNLKSFATETIPSLEDDLNSLKILSKAAR